MRARAAGLSFLFLVGCAASPAGPFDAGFDLHVIVRVVPPSLAERRVRPVITVGERVVRVESRPIAPDGPGAVEVAIVRAAPGEHRLAIWDPVTKSGARATVAVAGERWALIDLAADGRPARLQVYDEPPHAEIGSWLPLIAVPR
jgi:hypothetical protein